MAFVAAVVLAVASLTALLFAAGKACNNVPSMTRTDACHATDSWETLCQQTLQNAPDTAELTVYALIATRLAKQRYEDVMANDLDPMLGAGNLPDAERVAVSQCKEKYGYALSRIAGVADQMLSCDFTLARQEYIDAEVSVGSCRDGLLSYQSLPLFTKVSADYDLTVVAYLLGALIVGR